MNLALPALLIVWPLALALVAVAVGRWPRPVVVLGTLAALVLALLALMAGRSESGLVVATGEVAGRAFELSRFDARFLALLAAGLAVLFALQWDRAGAPALVAGGLAAWAFVAAALMIQPFAFGAVLLLAAAAVCIPALTGGRFAAASATWVAFLAVGLAVPLLVAAGWLLNAGQAQSEITGTVLLLATLLLLGGFPFYVWVSGLARTASLPALTLLLAVVGGGSAVWLAEVLALFPVGGATMFRIGLAGSVLLSVAVGAFGLGRGRPEPGVEAGTAGWREWLAYGLVIDAALQVAAMLTPGPAVAVVAVAVLGRLLALLLLAALAGWMPEQGSWRVGRQVMIAYVGLMLIGLPLTPSFSARWEALVALAGQSPLVVALVVLGLGVATAAGVKQALSGTLLPVAAEARSGRRGAIAPAILVILALFMGILSPYLLEYLAKLAAG